MDTIYRVLVDLKTTGNLVADSFHLKTAVSGLGGAFSMMGGAFSSMVPAITNVVGKVGELATSLAKVGATAAVAGITHDAFKLNKEIENTQIGLATIFNMKGAAPSMGLGMSLAGDTMAQIRKDAAALPGETQDLVGIFRAISSPGLGAGLSPQELEKFAAKTMAVSAAGQIPFEVAGREMAALLSGHSGGHNILGRNMFGLQGAAAEEFNKKAKEDPTYAFKFLSEQMKTADAAIEVMGRSFEGMWTGVLDKTHKFRADVTKPLFERWKEQLGIVSSYLDSHASQIDALADKIGQGILRAWDFVSQKIQSIAPLLHRAGAAADKFFAPGHTAEHLGVAGGAMLGAKMAPQAFGLLETAGIEAGPAGLALMAVAGAFHAVTDESSSMHLAAMTAWQGIKSGFDGLVQAVQPLIPSIMQIADVLGVTLMQIVQAAMPVASALAEALQPVLQTLGSVLQELSPHIANLAKSLGSALASSIKAIAPLAEMAAAGLAKLAPVLGALAEAASSVAGAIGDAADWIAGAVSGIAKVKPASTGGGPFEIFRMAENAASPVFQQMFKAQDILKQKLIQGSIVIEPTTVTFVDKKKGPSAAGGGGGGTHIQKVEIVVSSNQDPSRIARFTATELVNINRHPRVSHATKNWSAARP